MKTGCPVHESIAARSPRHGAIVRTGRARAGRPTISATAGFQLIEVLVYMAALTVLLSVAYVAFNRALERSEALRRSADDIVRALRAGERWRADVRSAAGPIRIEHAVGGERLVIPVAGGVIAYEHRTNVVVRRPVSGPEAVLLQRVRASAMSLENREAVRVWRWELELQPPTRKPVQVRPLFTFLAVSGEKALP